MVAQSTQTAEMSQLKLRITRTFNAPRELVWRAWTQPEHLLQWYAGQECEPTFAEIDLRPGGQWRAGMCWQGDKALVHRGEFREIDPPSRLVFTHYWEEASEIHACQTQMESVITVTLESCDGGTQMTFEQVGFISAESRDSHEGGWGAAFNLLTTHLDTTADDADRAIVITRTFDAPRDTVWRAWTEPDQIAKWCAPSGFTVRVEEHDLRVDGTWRQVMIGPDGTEYPCKGTFLQVEPLQRIVTTDEFDEGFETPTDADLPQGMITDVTFADDGNDVTRTRVTIRIMHPSVEDRRKHEAMGVMAGWHSTLDCLENLLQELIK